MEDDEVKKRIEDAKRFENVLSLFPLEQKELLKHGSDEVVRKLFEERGISNPSEVILARDNWLRYWAAEPPKEQVTKEPPVPKKKSPFANFLSSLATLAQGVAVGVSILKPGKKEEEKPQDQPRTRFEQMEQAGKKITEGISGDESWGVSEIPPPPIPEQSPTPQSRIGSRPFIPSPAALGGVRNRLMPLRRSGNNNWRTPEKPDTAMARKTRGISKLRSKISGKKIAKSLAKKAVFGSLGLPAIIMAVIVAVGAIVFFIIILATGCYIVNNPIGDVLGINYCKFEVALNEPAIQPTTTPPTRAGRILIPECGILNVNINLRLKQDFGITIKEGPPPSWSGLPAENVNCTARKGIYKTFAMATQSYRYKNKITSRPLTIQFFQGNIGGYSGNIDLIQLSDGAKRYNDYAYGSNLFYIPATWIIHESAHILQQRDGSLENKFPNLEWLGKDPRSKDRDCYEYRPYQKGWIFKTYSKAARVSSAKRESMAEAIALYIYNHKRPVFGNEIKSFKIECPNTYAWVKRNIYDPKEFN